ncbi:MAG: class I SAM-dependent methyltransferase [Parvularculaceae bacterium]|nr:class I SAM-dependent methyltransferase [Parvularculaceae bacterium]
MALALGGVFVAAAAVKLRATIVEIAAAIARLGGEVDALRATVNDIRVREISDLKSRDRSLETRLRDLKFDLEERSNLASKRLRDLKFDLEERSNLASKQLRRLQNDVEKQAGLLTEARTAAKRQAHAVDRRFVETLEQFKKVDDRLGMKASAEKLSRIEDRALQIRNALNDLSGRVRGYHVHDRTLSKADLEALRREWAEPLGLEVADSNIGYMASRIASIEGRCVGRLATSSQTMIARLLAARSISASPVNVLEIGVLFGVASACFYDILAEFGAAVRMTLIDPLDGYYSRDAADLITGVPVSRQALDRNLASVGAPTGAFEVIQRFSTDEAAIAAVKGREFDLLLIDGDHDYNGVKWDYENFGPLVRKGGIILFDDYDVGEWPDIKRFVDETPAANPSLQWITKGFRTAAFRVVDQFAPR